MSEMIETLWVEPAVRAKLNIPPELELGPDAALLVRRVEAATRNYGSPYAAELLSREYGAPGPLGRLSG